MPSTARQLFDDAGLEPDCRVRWGERIPRPKPDEPKTGVYIVALNDDADTCDGTLAKCPLDHAALDELLAVRPELRLDGKRPTVPALGQRLAGFWLPDEGVLYVGLAGQPLTTRVRQYYRTPLGADKPHAGGWPLKTLRVVPELWVHVARTDNYEDAEKEMLAGFARRVSNPSRKTLYLPDPLMPFANLRDADYRRKQHGITGATGPMPTRR